MVGHCAAAAEQARDVPRADDRKVLNGILWRLRTGSPWGGHPRAVLSIHDLLQPLRSLAEDRRLGSLVCRRLARLRRRSADGRQFLDPRPSARVECQKGARAPPPGTSLQPDAWALARRTDHQDPHGRGRQRQSHRPEAERRPGWAQRRRSAGQCRPQSDPARRPRLRQRRFAGRPGRAGRVRQYQADAAPGERAGVQSVAIAAATSSSASSASSSTPAPSPSASRSTTPTTSRSSNWPHRASGCGL